MSFWSDLLRDCVVVLDSELDEASSRADGRIAKGGVAGAQHPKLGWQTVQVQADTVEVHVRGASRQRRGHCILRGCVFGNWFLSRV